MFEPLERNGPVELPVSWATSARQALQSLVMTLPSLLNPKSFIWIGSANDIQPLPSIRSLGHSPANVRSAAESDRLARVLHAP